MSLQPHTPSKTPLLKPLARALAPLALGFVVFSAHAAVPQTERDALVALYNSTDGANWRESSNWLTDDPCDNAWHGVTCNDSGSHVVQLELSNNRLSGSIPESLGQLSALELLYLNNNRLSGPIPESLGQLSALQHLILDDNQLSGSIPDSLGHLSALHYLYLSHNQLSGPIPDLSALSLTVLHLENNQLSGPLPPPPARGPGPIGAPLPFTLCPNPLDTTPSAHDDAWAAITYPPWPEGCTGLAPTPEPDGDIAPIPTLGGWAMMLLAGLLGFLGVSRRPRV